MHSRSIVDNDPPSPFRNAHNLRAGNPARSAISSSSRPRPSSASINATTAARTSAPTAYLRVAPDP